MASGVFLGVLSTISNGVFLVFTAPMWMIGGIIAVHGQRNLPVQKLPGARWSDLVPYARFPQGMPPGVELRALLSRRRIRD